MGVIQQQTIKGTIFSYLGVLIGFISLNVIQPHTLSTEQIGLTGILLSFSLLFAQFTTLGFSGTSRYFPYFRDESKQHHGYLFLFCTITFIGFLIFLGLSFIFKDEIISAKSQKSEIFDKYYWYLIPLTFFTVYFNVFDLYARVLYNAISGRILREFTKRVLILVTILLIYLELISFDTFMLLWLLANVIPTFILAGILIKNNQFFLKPDFGFLDKGMRKRLRNISIFSLLTGASPLIVENIDKYIINEKFGLSQTGVYTIAYYFATIITLPARSLYSIATTVVAESWKANDVDNINKVYKKSCITQLITALFLLIIIWANIDNLLHFLPPSYQSGKYVILFVGIANLIDSATGISGVILSTSKYYRYDAYFYVLLIGVTIAGNLLLIPHFGITGSAMATALTFLVFNTFRYLFILYVFKMQPFTVKCLYTLVLGISIYFFSELLIPRIDNYFVDIFIRSAFISCSYWLCIYFLNLSEDINQFLRGYLIKLNVHRS